MIIKCTVQLAGAAALLALSGCAGVSPAGHSTVQSTKKPSRAATDLPTAVAVPSGGLRPDDCVRAGNAADACSFGLPRIDPSKPCEDNGLGIAGTAYYRCFGSRWVDIHRSDLPVAEPSR